jgi:hypothetical protein
MINDNNDDPSIHNSLLFPDLDDGSFMNDSPQTELTFKDINGALYSKYDRIERHSRLSNSSSFSALHLSNSPQLTTFLLLNTMIGSGILNQPYVFRESGLVGGLIGFVIASIGVWYGLLCLTEAGIYLQIFEYSGLAKAAFNKNGEILVDISIIVLTFGAQLGYILIVGTTLSELLSSWGCNYFMCNDFFTTILSVGIFVTPVCLFRHFGHLAYLSLFSIAAIVAVLLLVIIGGPIKHVEEYGPGIKQNTNIINIYGLLTSTGSIVFSLACASANFQAFISTDKKAQNMSSWSNITRNAVFSGTMMCMVMGTAGFSIIMFFNDYFSFIILFLLFFKIVFDNNNNYYYYSCLLLFILLLILLFLFFFCYYHLTVDFI